MKLHRVIGLLIISVSLVGGWFLWDYQLVKDASLPLDGPMAFEIKPGSSVRSVARDLRLKGLIEKPRYFEIMARLSGQARRLKVGEYTLPMRTTPRLLLGLFVEGRVKQYSLTLIEGWDFRQVLRSVSEHPALRHQLNGTQPEEVMPMLGLEGIHPEGRFYPDTYHFPRGMTDIEFLKRAYRDMEQALAAEWSRRAEALPYASPYEALIMASIVEKETGKASERAYIAGVFVRRLEKRMRLQTDPTVIYGMGTKYNGNIRKRDLTTDTPYNTYTRRGLPPTPIAMPGLASIRAALHPEDGIALYFVSKGDGSHYFSATMAEHNKAVDRYQRRRRPRSK